MAEVIPGTGDFSPPDPGCLRYMDGPIYQGEWRWFGCAGHFIAASRCRFHLHTRVGEYRISTVGEYVLWREDDFTEVGLGRLYETMVFRVEDGDADGCPGEGHVSDWSEVASDGYNTWQDAHRGHLAMCAKYAAKPSVDWCLEHEQPWSECGGQSDD